MKKYDYNGSPAEKIELLKKHIVNMEATQHGIDKVEILATIARELAQNIADTARDPLIVLDGDLKIISVNEAFYNTFKVKPNETLGKFIYDLGNRQWDIPKLRKLLEEILPANSVFNDYVIEHDFQSIGKRVMVVNARCIQRLPQKANTILLAIEDITDIDKLRISFQRMTECGVFTDIANENKTTIVELKNEVNALLTKLGEKLKYNT